MRQNSGFREERRFEGWGIFLRTLLFMRLAQKKTPPPGGFHEEPLYPICIMNYINVDYVK